MQLFLRVLMNPQDSEEFLRNSSRVRGSSNHSQAQTFFPYQAIIIIIYEVWALILVIRARQTSLMQRSALVNIAKKEHLRTMMENPVTAAATEDRLAALEKKVREMEALVKGLTQELLDLKSVAMKMSKQTEERSRQELKRGPIVQGAQAPAAAPAGAPAAPAGSSTVVMRKGARVEAPAAPAEPAMDLIMQPDGTMKMEPRRGDKNYIVASAGYGRNKKGTSVKAKQSDLIYAVEEDKADPAKK